MSWIRMKFKGERVWVRADESGRPVLDGDGRAEMKYRETDAKSYRPALGNLLPDDGREVSAEGSGRTMVNEARPRPAPARAHARKPSAPSERGGAVEIWTDGACSGNPGPMGIGVVVIDGEKRKEH